MSSHNTKKPTGGVHMRRVTEPPNPNDHLLERILSRENMHKAWKWVKSNKGAPGVNGMSIRQFPRFSRDHWNSIRQSLLDGTYQPLPVKRVEIPKPTGGRRPLGIPIVMDWLIQQAICHRYPPWCCDPHEPHKKRPLAKRTHHGDPDRHGHAEGVT